MVAVMEAAVRWVIIALVVALLARAAVFAWRSRSLASVVWRRVRLRHVGGAIGLLLVVISVAIGLLLLVPVTGYGLGSLIGFDGNAVFAPIEDVIESSPAVTGVPAVQEPGGLAIPWQIVVVGAFLALLVLLFPFLAYAEERAFRSGLEEASLRRELGVALRFGLTHLVMLIPVAAALAIGVAGFVYGRIYRAAHRRALAQIPVLVAAEDGTARIVLGERATSGPVVPSDIAISPHGARRRAREEALLEATTWHTTFNTVVAGLVFAAFAVSYL